MSIPKILIMPDIHGRTFWKDALNIYSKELYPDLDIIFLGDYIDPYENYDGISKEDAYNNFLEILDVAKNDNRIQLLIGNHDWHYFVNLDNCRIDTQRLYNIKKLFIDNLDMFRISKTIDVSGTKYLFTHAGITSIWLDEISSNAHYEIDKWNPGDVNPKDDPKYLWISEIKMINKIHNFELFEECLKNYNDSFYSCILSMIARERGGWNTSGSCIWADVHEHLYSSNKDIEGYYQIFGHTITYPDHNPKAWSISPDNRNFAMLDASRSFILCDDNHIY